MALKDVPRAAGASGRDLRGRCSIAGLLRTAVGGLRRALYPLAWCSGSGTRRSGADFFLRFANCGGRRRRWRSRMYLELLGRAAATYGVAARSPGCCAQRLGGSGVLSIRWRGAAAAARGDPGLISFCVLRIAVGAGGDGAQGCTSSCWGERPRPTGSLLDRRAVAHSGWGAQACSLSLDAGAAAAARGDRRKTRRLLVNRPCASFATEE